MHCIGFRFQFTLEKKTLVRPSTRKNNLSENVTKVPLQNNGSSMLSGIRIEGPE